jgi:hypothetical protein
MFFYYSPVDIIVIPWQQSKIYETNKVPSDL